MKKCNIILKLLRIKDLSQLEWLESLIDEFNSPRVLTRTQKECLKRGNVVWVDFGINIGNEFSGKHPAIILRAYKNGKTAYFLPIDSGFSESDYCVNFERIYGFPDENRNVNTYRVFCLSTSRIDFNNKIGHINTDLLCEIDKKIKKYQY